MNQTPRNCLITGGTSGIGLATALKFARSGDRVVVCGRNSERLESARNELLAESDDKDSVLAVQADVTRPDEIQALVDRAVDAFQSIDLLVNNAAIAPLAPLDEMEDGVIDSCVDLNIRGVYYVTRSVWQTMKRQGRGLVVNISSQAAVDPFAGFSLYGATKAWIETFTHALAAEGREHGIRCYGIRPGAVETPMLRGLFPDFPSDQCVSPQEVADAVWGVCQPEWVNSSGQLIKVSRQ